MSTSRNKLWAIVVAVGAACLLLPTQALASPGYPTEIFDAIDMDCPPPCAVCHQDQTGGAGTATKVFADAMVNEGLEGENDSSVKPALEALDAAGTDSDGDGVGDVSELKQGRNPNIPGDSPICGPQYGCGARIAKPPAAVDSQAALLALCVAGLLVLGSRRRRISPSKRR